MKTESAKKFPQYGIATGWVHTPSVPGVNVCSDDNVPVYNTKIYINGRSPQWKFLHHFWVKAETFVRDYGKCCLIFHWKYFLKKSNAQMEVGCTAQTQKISIYKYTIVLRSVYILLCVQYQLFNLLTKNSRRNSNQSPHFFLKILQSSVNINFPNFEYVIYGTIFIIALHYVEIIMFQLKTLTYLFHTFPLFLQLNLKFFFVPGFVLLSYWPAYKKFTMSTTERF